MLVKVLKKQAAYGGYTIFEEGQNAECEKINSKYAYLIVNDGCIFRALAKDIKIIKK